MGKPSMFSKDYHKRMWRRKIIFRTLILIIAFGIIFLTYNRSAIPNLKKIIGNVIPPIMKDINLQTKVTPTPKKDIIPNVVKGDKEKPDSNTVQKPDEQITTTGEYIFKLSDIENLTIIYSKNENNRFTGIKSSDAGVTFDISDDGKAVVFDNPKTSDIWICNINGEFKRLNSDKFIEFGNDKAVFNKSKVMAQFENNYIWAARPKFLKDGRVIYQSYLPWLSSTNNCYLWVVDSDGQNNRYILAGATDGSGPVKYTGFTQDNMLIIESSGKKYVVNVDDKSKQRID